MDTATHQEQLEQAQQLNEDGKPKAALRLLSPLYKADEDNPEIIHAVVDTLELLENWVKARSVLLRAVSRQPQQVNLWIRLSYIFLAEENLKAATRALEKGLVANPNHLEILCEQARLAAGQNQREAMHQAIEDALAAHPDAKAGLLVERASLYQSLAFVPEDGEAQIKDALGLSVAVVPMRQALSDLTSAIALDETAWRFYVKRADVNKRLQEFDAAIADYDQALKYLDEAGEPLRSFLEEERDGCGNGGRNEREALANSMRDAIKSADEGDLNMEECVSNNLVKALADQYAEGGDMLALLEEVDADPDAALALSIAQDILKGAREPYADYKSVNAAEFSRSVQAYCNKVEKSLAVHEFVSLGDYEPRGLRQLFGKRALVRIFLSADRQVCAAVYRYSPAKPALWIWLIMLLLRQWKHYSVVELESVTRDGHFLVTNNTGKINPFINSGSTVDVLAMPPDVRVDALVLAHQSRMGEGGDNWIDYRDIDGVLEHQEQLRLIKNAYREKMGFVTDDELKSLLGKHYEKYASRVKKYLQILTQCRR